MTNFHSIIAAAIDEGDLICLSSHPYNGFQLYGVPVSHTDLMQIASESKSLADQLNQVREETEAMLADVEPASAKTPDDELNAASAVFCKYLDSGYLLEIIAHGYGIGWVARPTE